MQGSKIVLVRSYLRVSQAAGQVNILIFLVKIKFSPCMPTNFVMQGKYLFSDISRPGMDDLFAPCHAQFDLVASLKYKINRDRTHVPIYFYSGNRHVQVLRTRFRTQSSALIMIGLRKIFQIPYSVAVAVLRIHIISFSIAPSTIL